MPTHIPALIIANGTIHIVPTIIVIVDLIITVTVTPIGNIEIEEWEGRRIEVMMNPAEVNHPTPDETSLFQPDSLLPVQYFENFRRKVQTEPEKRLMLAVLEDALVCFQKHFSSRGGRGLRLFRETEEWIFRGENGQPFSFANICEVVGFDTEYMRQGLLKWRERKINDLSIVFSQWEPKQNGTQTRKIPDTQRRRPETRSRMVGLGL
jgi:hypothetical protein